MYSRMGSEAHGDAEETLRYLFGQLGTEEQFNAMAIETVWTTRMYVHYAASWFVRASIFTPSGTAWPRRRSVSSRNSRPSRRSLK
jgi:hypothetical protein